MVGNPSLIRIMEGLPVIHPGIGWKRQGSNFPDPDFSGGYPRVR